MKKICFKYTLPRQLALVLAAYWMVMGVSGCSSDPASATTPQGDPEVIAYLKDNWGITISGFNATWKQEDLANGSTSASGSGTIAVDGLGKQQLNTLTLVIPDELGTSTTFFVSKPDGSEERFFQYDRMNQFVIIGNDNSNQSVIVYANPDKTYQVDTAIGDVWTTVATNVSGYEALQTVETYNEFKSISPHILLMAFAAAHTPSTLESRAVTVCSTNALAAAPAVCSIFREFCDCAACLVLNRQGACDVCPQL